MQRHTALILALATLSATAAVSLAQNASPAAPDNSQMNNVPMQAQPAPIERGPVSHHGYNSYVAKLEVGQVVAPIRATASALPAAGIFLRVGDGSSVRAIALGGENTELRVENGIANISVHHPIKNARILVDLPGGQANLIKDGFYTFNADTNTIRVLKGKAFAYPGGNTNQRPIKVKGDQAVIFNGPNIKAFEFDPFEARADLIPYGPRSGGPGESGDYGPYGGYPYYDYGYPYYYYGYPYYYDPFLFDFGFYGGGFYGGGYGGHGGGWGGGHGGGWGGGHGGGWGGGGGGWGGGGGHGGGGGGGGHR
jgi:hypothetical protein